MRKNTDMLLLEIQGFAQCSYLSDLRAAALDERAKVLISQIPDNRYDISDWNEAASYITGTICNCQSIREVKKKIHC